MDSAGSAREVDLDEWVGRPRRRERPKTYQPERERLHAQAKQMMGSGDWTGANAAHLVPLYALCHLHVYGVAPAEVDDPVQHAAAVRAARAFLKRDFADDVVRAVEFFRWVWRREAWRERRAAETGAAAPRYRIGWRLQFGPSLVTDWRVDEARRAARGK